MRFVTTLECYVLRWTDAGKGVRVKIKKQERGRENQSAGAVEYTDCTFTILIFAFKLHTYAKLNCSK